MKVIFMKKTFIETFLEYMEDSYEQPLEEKHLKYAKEDFGYISPYVDGSQWNLEDIKEFSFHSKNDVSEKGVFSFVKMRIFFDKNHLVILTVNQLSFDKTKQSQIVCGCSMSTITEEDYDKINDTLLRLDHLDAFGIYSELRKYVLNNWKFICVKDMFKPFIEDNSIRFKDDLKFIIVPNTPEGLDWFDKQLYRTMDQQQRVVNIDKAIQ